MRRRSGFSLVELLAVVGIIAILMSILLPVLGRARVMAARTGCLANLRDLAGHFQAYLNDSGGKLPRVNTMPSIQPPVTDAPSLGAVLSPSIRDATGVLRCPADHIRQPVATPGPVSFDTYYEREGSSYQYSPFLSALLAGKKLSDHPMYQGGRQATLPVLFDYESFHGVAGKALSTNYLFADWHVGDIVD